MRVGILLALALVGAAPDARVLKPKSFGPVRVGMTRAQTERALAARLLVDYPDEDSQACGMARRRDGRDKAIHYMIENGRVARIDVDDPKVTTARGVGIGSTVAQVRRAYGKALRSQLNQYSEQPDLEIKGPRGFGIIFETDGQRVLTMRGGRYPAVAYVESCL